MKKFLREATAVFFSLILVLAIFNFSIALNSNEVIAANVDTCGITNDGNYCVEVNHGEGWDKYKGCKDGHEWQFQTRNEVSECAKGVCVSSSAGACLENVEKIRCIAEQAGTFHQGASKESVEACSIGCCVQYGSCSVQEEKVCNVDLGGDEFVPGVSNRDECNLECAGSVVGCYKRPEGGQCEYGSLEKFRSDPEFVLSSFKQTYCSNVVGCPSYRESHAYKSCGDGTTDDDKWDVYWYDSDGNREELVEECRPEGMCDDPDDVIGGEDAVCLSTSCVEDSPDTWPSEFKSGESICLNTLSGFFTNEKRSKGLHNYILTCQNRDVKPDFDDKNRGKRCEEALSLNESRVEADWVDNEWKDCDNCGDGRGIIDILNYAPGVGQLLANAVGKQCSDDKGWFGLQDKCSDFGDCSGGPLMQNSGYDRDIWAPIGSCNPTYPPGEESEGYGDSNNRCGQCGKGGDGTVNVCTEFECNAMGDCQFEKDGFPTTGMLTTGALAAGTLGTGIVACSALSIFGIEAWGACSAGVGGIFFSLSLSGILFWGVVSTIYGVAAAKSTHDTIQDPKDLYADNGKIKLAYTLSLAKYLEDTLSDEEKAELANKFSAGDSGTTANWLTFPASASLGALSAYAAAHSFELVFVAGGEFGTTTALKLASTLGISHILLTKILAGIGILASFVITSFSFKTGQCIPEQPYTNPDHCGECGLDGQWYCTQKRCDILGSASGWCEFVPFSEGGTVDGLCLPSEPSDHSSPYLTSIAIDFRDSDNLTIQGPFSAQGRVLDVSQPVQWDVDHTHLKINTSEISQCKYSFAKGTAYESMTTFPWAASLQHEIDISFAAEDKIRDKTYMYIKCNDIAGNTNKEDRDYISFSFEEAPDEQPPIIDYINPMNINVPESTTDINFMLYAYDKNKVLDCRYSKSNDSLNYVDMTSFGAKTNTRCSQTDETCQKFSSSFNLAEEGWCSEINFGEAVNDIIIPFNATFCPLYIKCADMDNNVMENPFLWGSVIWPKFKLDIIKPNESFTTYDDNFEIELLTDNEALCKYKLGDDWFNISTSFSRTHSIIHNELVGSPSGIPYNILFECTDFAGNAVNVERSITAFRNVDAPVLLRVWTTNQQLHILVNEESTCKYSNTEPNFDFEDSTDIFTMISTRNGKEHYASLGEKAYYIKCRDKWDNENINPFIIYP